MSSGKPLFWNDCRKHDKPGVLYLAFLVYFSSYKRNIMLFLLAGSVSGSLTNIFKSLINEGCVVNNGTIIIPSTCSFSIFLKTV